MPQEEFLHPFGELVHLAKRKCNWTKEDMVQLTFLQISRDFPALHITQLPLNHRIDHRIVQQILNAQSYSRETEPFAERMDSHFQA
ncbi:hypothetical protein D3C85_1790860 [compost metagenome]